MAGIAALAGLAGCAGLSGGDSPSGGTPTDSQTTAAPTTAEPTTTEEPPTPHDFDAIHLHGTMVAEINDTTYHFGDKPWNMEERTGVKHFHFHTDDEQDTWHVHSKGVTLGFGVETMPKLEVGDGTITFRGHTYNSDDAGTEIAITANGEEIADVDQYVLQGEDEIVFGVTTDAETPTPASSGDAQDVTFQTMGGTPVDGTMYGSGSCGVVLVPQVDQDRGSWEPQAAGLAEEGFRALAIDEGDSPVEAVLGAVTFLVEEQGVEHVSLVGASAGGEAVVEAAARADQDAVGGVATLSASGGEEAVSGFDGRLLVVVSRMDEERFVDTAEALYENGSEPKRLEVVDGSAHGQNLFTSDQGSAVTDLLREHVSGVCG